MNMIALLDKNMAERYETASPILYGKFAVNPVNVGCLRIFVTMEC